MVEFKLGDEMQKVSYNDIQNIDDDYRVIEFLKSHLSNYTEREMIYIMNNYKLHHHAIFVPDILRQIYDEVGLLADDKNLYLGFMKILEDNFNLDSNIVEIGGGIIPSLAKHIHLKQKNGTITVYDPRLYKNDSSDKKFILKKEKFTENTDIFRTDILVGFMPCQATEILIKTACRNKKDFLVALCEGGHQEFEDFYDDTLWEEQMIDLAKREIAENGMGVLEKTNLESYGDPYPIIYNKRIN